MQTPGSQQPAVEERVGPGLPSSGDQEADFGFVASLGRTGRSWQKSGAAGSDLGIGACGSETQKETRQRVDFLARRPNETKAAADPRGYDVGERFARGALLAAVCGLLVGSGAAGAGPPPAYGFDAMRGGNVFGGRWWFGQTIQVLPAAKRMNLNFIRINVDMHRAILNQQEDQLLNALKAAMNAMAADGMKVIVTFGGYAMYDQDCTPNGSFEGVESLARKIVMELKGHSALYAWELMNEALSTQGDRYRCDHKSIIKSVHAMYQLVRSIDETTPTTVSEAWYWWYLPNWKDISTFGSFHIYPKAELPLTPASLQKSQEALELNIDRARAAVAPLPLVLGEFGMDDSRLSEVDKALFYQTMYKSLRRKDIGSFFWNLSLDDIYSVLNRDGTIKTQGAAVQAELSLSPLSIIKSGSKPNVSILLWNAPKASSCEVYEDETKISMATDGVAIISNGVVKHTYKLACVIGGQLKVVIAQ